MQDLNGVKGYFEGGTISFWKMSDPLKRYLHPVNTCSFWEYFDPKVICIPLCLSIFQDFRSFAHLAPPPIYLALKSKTCTGPKYISKIDFKGAKGMFDQVDTRHWPVPKWRPMFIFCIPTRPSFIPLLRNRSIFMGVRDRKMSGGQWWNLPWPRPVDFNMPNGRFHLLWNLTSNAVKV